MISISLCMIVKNEEDVIGRCLECVKDVVDEIIVVDTGSTDSTIEIVKKYTNKVYHFNWVDDFSKARNYAFSKASKDYIMWLDADDVIFETDLANLKQLKNNLDTSVDMVMMKYNVAFDEYDNPTLSYYRERLVSRKKNYQWISPIHEVIPPSGNIIYSDIAISHKKLHSSDKSRNLRIFNKMLMEGLELDPRQQFYYSRELYYNGQYQKAIDNFNNFLDSKQGWVENCISACIDLSDCYKKINDNNNAFLALLRSFEFDKPRPEICCKLGNHFLENNNVEIAIFWYELAISNKPDMKNGGFHNADYFGYIPYIQFCVCYDKIGNMEKAIFYNNKAGRLKPNDKASLYNKNYFQSKNIANQ